MCSQNLKIQMKDFEATAEPLSEWLSTTEKMVQGSSSRLHDLPSKRREHQKLQVTSYKPFNRTSFSTLILLASLMLYKIMIILAS